MKNLNHIKIIFVEEKRENKWLTAELCMNPTTISKRNTNVSQSNLYKLDKMTTLFELQNENIN